MKCLSIISDERHLQDGEELHEDRGHVRLRHGSKVCYPRTRKGGNVKQHIFDSVN
jgi:hypothetical protein